MNMKRLLYIITLLTLGICISCEKINLDTQEEPKQEATETTDKGGSSNKYDVEANNLDAPYTVADIISGRFLENFENQDSIENVLNAYVKGYIVGYVSGSTMSTAKFKVGDVETNILLADYVNENDIKCCIPVQLKKGTPARDALNLVDNPDVFGNKFLLCGTISPYMGVNGMKDVSWESHIYVTEKEYKETTDDEKEDEDNSDDTSNKILSVSDIRRVEIGSLHWVEGYIVGYVPRGKNDITSMVFGIPNGTNDDTNIIIADSINESDIEKCVAVQLSKKTEARDSLNLYNNPENLHRKVQIHGTIQLYMSQRGIGNVDAYKFP